MQQYRVLNMDPRHKQFALQGRNGYYHLARALSDMPPVGALLQGARPHLGFGILVCLESGTVFRATFEAINSASPQFQLHALPPAATPHWIEQGQGRSSAP